MVAKFKVNLCFVFVLLWSVAMAQSGQSPFSPEEEWMPWKEVFAPTMNENPGFSEESTPSSFAPGQVNIPLQDRWDDRFTVPGISGPIWTTATWGNYLLVGTGRHGNRSV